MDYQAKLEQLYQKSVDLEFLTYNDLVECGFNKNEISELTYNKVFIKKLGQYYFADATSLYKYRNKLLLQGECDLADKCFSKCISILNENNDNLIKQFFNAVIRHDYATAFEYYDILKKANQSNLRRINKLYIYLIGYLTDLPEKHKKYLKSYNLENMLLRFGDEDKTVFCKNKIILMCITMSFKEALTELRNFLANKTNISYQDLLLDVLLDEVSLKEKNTQLEIQNLIKEENYKEAIVKLETKEKNNSLSKFDYYILKLLKIITNHESSLDNLIISDKKSKSLFQALENNNYKSALKKCKKRSSGMKEDESFIILEQLLIKVNDLIAIKNIKASTNEGNDQEKESSVDDIVYNIIIAFNRYDLDLSLKHIKKLLNVINKEEYEYILTNLIKASLLKNDISFSEVILCANQIIDASINSDYFVNKLEYLLEDYKLELANVYKDIISYGNKIGIFSVDLSVYDKQISKVEEVTAKNQLDESILKDEEFSIIEKCKNIAANKSIMLLPSCDYLKHKRILKIIRKQPDVDYNVYDDGDNKVILIKYVPYKREKINVKETLNKANEAYNNQCYNQAINYYKKLIYFGYPSATIFAKLGFSYLKTGRKNTAIDYLTVADFLNSQNNHTWYNLKELIISLTSPTKDSQDEERKPNFYVDESEFLLGVNNYGIDNLDEIIEFIIENNLDVESACRILFFDEEKINILKLLISREYLFQNEIAKAEEFLKSVDKSLIKTETVKKVYQEIQKNKSLYLKRNMSNLSMKLTLTLKP